MALRMALRRARLPYNRLKGAGKGHRGPGLLYPAPCGLFSALLAEELLTEWFPRSGEQRGRYYHPYQYPLLAADDCCTVCEQSTASSGSTENSMPPDSKSSESLPNWAKLGELLKLPVLPNCSAGTHWLA